MFYSKKEKFLITVIVTLILIFSMSISTKAFSERWIHTAF